MPLPDHSPGLPSCSCSCGQVSGPWGTCWEFNILAEGSGDKMATGRRDGLQAELETNENPCSGSAIMEPIL